MKLFQQMENIYLLYLLPDQIRLREEAEKGLRLKGSVSTLSRTENSILAGLKVKCNSPQRKDSFHWEKKKKVRTLVGDSIVESTVVVSRTTPYQAFYLSFMIKALLFVTTSICKRKEVHSEGHIDDYRSLVSYSLKTPLK